MLVRTLSLLTILSTAALAEPVIVRITTTLGNIQAEIDVDRAPKTAANFLKYVDARRFHNAEFVRAVNKDGAGLIQARRASGTPAFPPIPLEPTSVTGLSHKDGALSMGRFGRDTATSSFFICIGDQSPMDSGGNATPDGEGYAVFGRVVEGMDIVRTIQAAPADGKEALRPPIRILSIQRLRPVNRTDHKK